MGQLGFRWLDRGGGGGDYEDDGDGDEDGDEDCATRVEERRDGGLFGRGKSRGFKSGWGWGEGGAKQKAGREGIVRALASRQGPPNGSSSQLSERKTGRLVGIGQSANCSAPKVGRELVAGRLGLSTVRSL